MKGLALIPVVVCLCAGVVTASPVVYDLMPLESAADESGFGTLQAELASPFSAVGYSGMLTSRVYTDTATTPGNVATFVWDIALIDGAAVENMTIAATGLQSDLRIMQIVNGLAGTIVGSDVPDVARATDNDFSTADELIYAWGADDRLAAGESATLFVQVTGVTQMGEVNAAIQNFGGSNATVLAPVDDMNSPDLTIPEPATLSLLAAGMAGLVIRRRR